LTPAEKSLDLNVSGYRQHRVPGLNFINVLRAAFACADQKCVKMTVKVSIFFTLLGSTSVKAACRTLMKLTPDQVEVQI